ncbi:hypothetical protein EV122DRAFT_268040 [Schizophyllum commune]
MLRTLSLYLLPSRICLQCNPFSGFMVVYCGRNWTVAALRQFDTVDLQDGNADVAEKTFECEECSSNNDNGCK